MRRSIPWRYGAALAALLAVPAAFGTYRTGLDTLVSPQGLAPARIAGLGLAYAQPGAPLASYDKVLLEPVDVAFRRDWQPYRPGSAMRLSDAQRESLRGDVARWVREAFAQTLQQGGLTLVEQPGPGVLRVRVHVVDLYLNNPGLVTFGRSRTFAASSGEITMVAELSDAASGAVLARVGDWEDMRLTGRLLPSNDIRTASDVQGVASNWARALRAAMGPARPADH